MPQPCLLAPPAEFVPEALEGGPPLGARDEAANHRLVEALLARQQDFGITRVGCVTRLDRVGVLVVQVVRPLSLSNAVSQGKGLTLVQAAASALMEELEAWAGENIPEARQWISSLAGMPPPVRSLYEPWVRAAPAGADRLPLAWLEGWNLLTASVLPVPLALVDTVYAAPSPHPHIFPRTTTGLGAGTTMAEAIAHAGLEVLERDAVARARAMPHFFDRRQVDPEDLQVGPPAEVLRQVRRAGLIAGLWSVPAPHRLPVYWCHIMEAEGSGELAPLPAEGFACDFSHEGAVTRALLEACQARLTAISGAREDVTRRAYPASHDRAHLAAWRRHLTAPGRAVAYPNEGVRPARDLAAVTVALEAAGAQAVLVVPLLSDRGAGLHVVRLVAPPLRSSWHG